MQIVEATETDSLYTDFFQQGVVTIVSGCTPLTAVIYRDGGYPVESRQDLVWAAEEGEDLQARRDGTGAVVEHLGAVTNRHSVTASAAKALALASYLQQHPAMLTDTSSTTAYAARDTTHLFNRQQFPHLMEFNKVGSDADLALLLRGYCAMRQADYTAALSTSMTTLSPDLLFARMIQTRLIYGKVANDFDVAGLASTIAAHPDIAGGADWMTLLNQGVTRPFDQVIFEHQILSMPGIDGPIPVTVLSQWLDLPLKQRPKLEVVQTRREKIAFDPVNMRSIQLMGRGMLPA